LYTVNRFVIEPTVEKTVSNVISETENCNFAFSSISIFLHDEKENRRKNVGINIQKMFSVHGQRKRNLEAVFLKKTIAKRYF